MKSVYVCVFEEREVSMRRTKKRERERERDEEEEEEWKGRRGKKKERKMCNGIDAIDDIFFLSGFSMMS